MYGIQNNINPKFQSEKKNWRETHKVHNAFNPGQKKNGPTENKLIMYIIHMLSEYGYEMLNINNETFTTHTCGNISFDLFYFHSFKEFHWQSLLLIALVSCASVYFCVKSTVELIKLNKSVSFVHRNREKKKVNR